MTHRYTTLKATKRAAFTPTREECEALNAPESTGQCCCRSYNGSDGLYIIDNSTGHAVAYYAASMSKELRDAVARWNAKAAAKAPSHASAPRCAG